MMNFVSLLKTLNDFVSWISEASGGFISTVRSNDFWLEAGKKKDKTSTFKHIRTQYKTTLLLLVQEHSLILMPSAVILENYKHWIFAKVGQCKGRGLLPLHTKKKKCLRSKGCWFSSYFEAMLESSFWLLKYSLLSLALKTLYLNTVKTIIWGYSFSFHPDIFCIIPLH